MLIQNFIGLLEAQAQNNHLVCQDPRASQELREFAFERLQTLQWVVACAREIEISQPQEEKGATP